MKKLWIYLKYIYRSCGAIEINCWLLLNGCIRKYLLFCKALFNSSRYGCCEEIILIEMKATPALNLGQKENR